MSSKQRVVSTLNHQQPDKVPVDYWAVPEVDKILLEKFRLENKEDLLNIFQVDFRYVKPVYTGSHFEEQPDGSLHRKLTDGIFVDIWGVQRKEIKWAKGKYLEVIRSPLAEVENVREIEDYPLPEIKSFDYHSLPDQCGKHDSFAIILTGDRLTTRASVFKLAMYLRGMDRLLMDLILNPKLVEALVSKLLEFHLEHNRCIFEVAADKIDIFMIGDDFGSENGLLISPANFRRFFKPALQKLIDLAKKFNLKVMLHSCGAVRELIPDFIEIGVDILNPVQTSARGMNPKELKREFGKYLSFHGSVDIQRILRFGTPEKVREEVKSLIKVLGEEGGFILAPSHNLQPDIPIGNIIAMYTTERDIEN